MKLKLSVLISMALTASTLSSPAHALNPEEKKLLHEIRIKTISRVTKQQTDALKLYECFSHSTKCDNKVKKSLPQLRRSIIQKNQDYRILTALSTGQHTGAPPDRQLPKTSAKLSRTTPAIAINLNPIDSDQSEYKVVNAIGKADIAAIKYDIEKRIGHIPASYSAQSRNEIYKLHQRESSTFYKVQAVMAIQDVPFIVFLKNDSPSDREIASALHSYIMNAREVIERMENLTEMPLETYTVFHPVVYEVIKGNPVKQRILSNLIQNTKHQVGLKAFLERHEPSLKLALFTTCSLVSAVTQSWPVAIGCGGALFTITGKQLVHDYFQMDNTFENWLMGTQTYKQLSTSEARVMYSTLAFLIVGQGTASTLLKAEGGLIASIEELPAIAAARFTNLTSLREGGARFVTNSANFKSKDLSASILAEATDKDLDVKKKSRKDRIFSYYDYLKIYDVIGAKYKK